MPYGMGYSDKAMDKSMKKSKSNSYDMHGNRPSKKGGTKKATKTSQIMDFSSMGSSTGMYY